MTALIKSGVKLGAVGGSIYYTNSLGVWGDSKQAEKAYQTVHSTLAPLVDDVPVEVPELPRLSEISAYSKNAWNKGVLATFRFLLDLPQHSLSYTKEGYQWISNQINSSSEAS